MLISVIDLYKLNRCWRCQWTNESGKTWPTIMSTCMESRSGRSRLSLETHSPTCSIILLRVV